MVENPNYDPMDEDHRAFRRRAIDRVADVEGAKRHQQPRDLTRLIVVMAVLVGTVSAVSTAIAVYSLVRLDAQQAELVRQQHRTAINRKATSDLLCGKLNDSIHASQANTDTLGRLIIEGVKASRAFERTYTHLGLPDYPARLKMAHDQVRQLKATKPKGIDCAGLAASIKRAAQ